MWPRFFFGYKTSSRNKRVNIVILCGMASAAAASSSSRSTSVSALGQPNYNLLSAHTKWSVTWYVDMCVRNSIATRVFEVLWCVKMLGPNTPHTLPPLRRPSFNFALSVSHGGLSNWNWIRRDIPLAFNLHVLVIPLSAPTNQLTCHFEGLCTTNAQRPCRLSRPPPATAACDCLR